MVSSTTIGVDVGGTKVAAGVVDKEGKILASTRLATPAGSPEGTLAAIVSAVNELLATPVGAAAEAVGIGAAGFIDQDRSLVRFAPNVAKWRNEPLADEVNRRVGLPIIVENDANAAAWGEARHGAGRGESHVVCVTVGTGIGGGIIVDGRLYRGRWGSAAEVGHLQIVPGGRPCGCGNRGCWEQYASGNALVRTARLLAAEDRQAARRMLELGDGTPEGITGRHVTLAAQEGDAVAVAAFQECGRWLGHGLADLAAVLDPGCFVIGGGVSEAGELLLTPARLAFAAGLTAADFRPLASIKPAILGNDAGVVGAADLARI